MSQAAALISDEPDTPSKKKSCKWSKKTAQEVEEEKEEENDILDWFTDIISGSESVKGKKDIRSQVCQQMKEHNVWARFTDATLRKAAATFGKLSHRIDLSYPPKEKLTRIDQTDDANVELIKDIKYCVRHALAPYKKFRLAFHTKESVVAMKSTKSLLRDYFGIPKKDIIIDNSRRNMKQFRNRVHAPRFYLAVDHKNNRIVLSIRGTATAADAYTDINAQPKAFNAFGIDGCVHEGILASAKHIFDNVTVDMVKLCKQYTQYQLIITGHSLGAGVSALLGLMYHQHPIICKQNHLKVFAFASPPVVSNEFIMKNIGMDYIVSITLSTDFITRLSIESVKHHNARNDLILEQEQELIDECMNVLDDTKENVENERIKFLTRLKTVDTPDPTQRLYPLGRVLWFVPNVVMEDDVVKKRKCLMCLDNDDEDNMNKEEQKEQGHVKQGSSGISLTWKSGVGLSLNIECDSNKKETSREKNVKKFGEENYVLCDATNCREIFQEFVVDYPESLQAHRPGRYLWACGASLTLENQ